MSVHSVENPDSTKGEPNSAEKIEETTSTLDDDWDTDPENPRNWPIGKKWVATAIVNAITSYIAFAFN